MVDATQSFSASQREKLPIGGVIAETFRIFGKAPLVFLLFGIVSQLPSLLGLLIRSAPRTSAFSVGAIILMIANLLVLFLIQTSMTYICVRLSESQPAPLGEAIGLGVRRYLAMLGTTILILLAVYGGMILLIVPGIIFSVMYAVAVPVCVVEGLGPVDSMKRSAALTRFTRWRIFAIYIIFFLPLIAIGLVGMFALIRNGHPLLGQGFNITTQVFWVPIATIFSTAIYIALRRIKENAGVARVFD